MVVIKRSRGIVILLFLSIFVLSQASVSYAQEDLDDYSDLYSELYASDTTDFDGSYYIPLIMDIYLDESGKMLLIGYISPDQINNLTFLDSSEYLYDEETGELYLVTDSLTSKQANSWRLDLSFGGYYTEGHISVYLPDGAVFKEVSYSEGFDHFVGMSDDVVVVDIQGFDMSEPVIVIEYQQNIGEGGEIPTDTSDTTSGENGGGLEGPGTGPDESLSYLIAVIALILVVVVVVYIVVSKRPKKNEHQRESDVVHDFSEPKKDDGNVIEVTSEMKKVIETLSDRERLIVEALIRSNGRLSQADIRYETEIPKSSLTGIIQNLEQKKIITKRQKGRTNIIELSEWFLLKKER